MFAEMLRQVRRVPRGKVATYGDIAYAAGYPGAARQVAWALHQGDAQLRPGKPTSGLPGAPLHPSKPTSGLLGTPLPWQRIVGAGGAILCTGELGFEQRMRLQAEGVSFIGLKVNMAAHHHSFFVEPPEKKKRGAKSKKQQFADERDKASATTIDPI